MRNVIRHKEKYVAAFAVLLLGGLILWFSVDEFEERKFAEETVSEMSEPVISEPEERRPVWVRDFDAEESDFVPPPSPDMDRMKQEGCIADGLLTEGFPKQGKMIDLINRSECYYLHRAIETWREPPDFDEVDRERVKLRDGFLLGMFIAEAIDVKDKYWYPEEKREFDFRGMCRPGSENFWGEHTCKPYIAREEYRDYVRYITHAAMERGVQVFMFGQIHYQDSGDPEDSRLPELLDDMRRTADYLGMDILIGAQTNDNDSDAYLRLFDFIEGGVGVSPNGLIEDGPCHSRWYRQEGDWCWALLWHERFAGKAKNVLVHYDWSGRIGDDMSTLARMDAATRRRTTARLHEYFTSRDIGFLLPFLTPLPGENGGCHGPSKEFYTPDDRYTCDDEDAWNQILSGKRE